MPCQSWSFPFVEGLAIGIFFMYFHVVVVVNVIDILAHN